jgi:uncharacterized Fe-S radical SAM superfamily protein PflX
LDIWLLDRAFSYQTSSKKLSEVIEMTRCAPRNVELSYDSLTVKTVLILLILLSILNCLSIKDKINNFSPPLLTGNMTDN